MRPRVPHDIMQKWLGFKVTPGTRKCKGIESRSPIDSNTMMTEVLELHEKCFRLAVKKKWLQGVIINMLETNKNIESLIKEVGSLSKNKQKKSYKIKG